MEKLYSNTTSITDTTRALIADILGMPPNEVQLESVSGGYSRNRRSLMGHDGRWAFVKEVDVDLLPSEGEEELWWLNKDYLCANVLRATIPELVPEWSRLEANGHALIMTSYQSSDGWLWSPPKNPELLTRYIQAIVDATRKIESLDFDDETVEKLKFQPVFRDEIALDGGIELIMQNEEIRKQLTDKYVNLSDGESGLLKRGYEQMIALLSDDAALRSLADRAALLVEQPNDCFGHCDVRSDNIAYNSDTRELKFVDWNWASFTPRGFGATEFLIDMARRGADITPWMKELNIELLAALVGFFAKRCLKDPLTPGSTLRDMQAESAAVALNMFRSCVQPADSGMV